MDDAALGARRLALLEAATWNAARVAAADVELDLCSDVRAAPRVTGPLDAREARGEAHDAVAPLDESESAVHLLDEEDDSGRRGDEPGDAVRRLDEAVERVLGASAWIGAHLGRGAEALVATRVRPGARVLANEVYVTGRFSIERAGGTVVHLPGGGPARGDLDPGALADALDDDVAWVQLTAPRALLSARGGGAVSLAGMEAVRATLSCRVPQVPLVLDASRLWENAAQEVLAGRPPGALPAGAAGEDAVGLFVRQAIAHADLVVLSGRKDAGGAHGGLVVARDPRALDPLRAPARLIAGGAAGGGMSAREVCALAAGLVRASGAGATQLLLRSRHLEELGRALRVLGVPLFGWGAGGLFLDARAWLPRLPLDDNPAQTLVARLLLHGGLRGIGTPVGERGPAVVRLAVRPGAELFLGAALPVLARYLAGIESGLVATGEAPPGPFLEALRPTRPEAWRDPAPVLRPPALTRGPAVLGGQAGDQLAAVVRARLGLDGRARVVPAPRGRGAAWLLTQTWFRLHPSGALASDEPDLHELAALAGAHAAPSTSPPTASVPTLRVGTLESLESLHAARRAGDAIAIDLGPAITWPAPLPGAAATVDVLWSNAPGSRSGGGLLILPSDTPLRRSLLESMLFFVGAPNDGGLSGEALIRLESAIAQ